MRLASSPPSAKVARSRREPALPLASPCDAAAVDGRRHRTVVTRQRIVEALTELIREGSITPTAEAVSARAGVGLRTVFRHFEDMETLYREINTEVDAVLLLALRAHLKAATWQERLLESVTLRARLFERVMPFYVGTQVHRHESKFLDAQIVRAAQMHRDLVRRLVPATVLADRPRFEALLLVLSVEAWIRLRREQGLGVARATQTMQLAAAALLAGVS